jgi:hypothetical protein
MPCPRCGTATDSAVGPFCPHCGRYLASLQWVAEPPPSAVPPVTAAVRPSRYPGPPRYRERPRGGFPALPWRPPDGPPPPPPPDQAVRSAAGVAVPLLWALAAVALLAGGAETWRYVLLLASRDQALSADTVAASDALVLAAGVGSVLLGLAAGGFLVTWTVQASIAAASRSGSHPSRSARDVVLGWVVPGVNLAVPGAVLAEIEHGALDRPASRRPRPSRVVGTWWVLWGAQVVLSVVTLLWSRRTGVQAQADGVLLHAWLDLLAATTAGFTAVLVGRLTALLGPVRQAKRQIVVSVGEKPVRPPAAAPATPA